MKLTDIKIGARLAVGFGIAFCLLLAISAVGLLALQTGRDHLREIVHDNVQKLLLVQTMSEQAHVEARVIRTVILLEDDKAIRAEYTKLEAAADGYNKAWRKITALPATQAGAEVLARIKQMQAQTAPQMERLFKLALAHEDREARALLLDKVAPLHAAWQAAIDEYVVMQEKSNEEDYAKAVSDESKATWGMLVLALIALASMTVVGLAITRSIVRPLGDAMRVVDCVAAGDLTQTVQASGRDEIAALISSIGRMVMQLRETVTTVRNGVESVATASAQIAQGNLDLSARTERQAASLQQTAASMHEIAEAVQSSAENARSADQLAAVASQFAAKGNEVAARAVATMTEVQASARKISEITALIDAIAFQTNILALNAAVEAARAGEQGRGFAVVASEVRSLAARSADSARQIRGLIDESVQKVDVGHRFVDDAGHAMRDIVQQVGKVTELMREITSSAREQSTGIGQVNLAVTELDSTTQQNSALVEESAAAATSLKGQAERLAGAVSVFRVEAA